MFLTMSCTALAYITPYIPASKQEDAYITECSSVITREGNTCLVHQAEIGPAICNTNGLAFQYGGGVESEEPAGVRVRGRGGGVRVWCRGGSGMEMGRPTQACARWRRRAGGGGMLGCVDVEAVQRPSWRRRQTIRTTWRDSYFLILFLIITAYWASWA